MRKVVRALCPEGHVLDWMEYEADAMDDLKAKRRLGYQIARKMIHLEVDDVGPECGQREIVYDTHDLKERREDGA